MFNPEQYFDAIQHTLRDSEAWVETKEVKPEVSLDRYDGRWTLIFWRQILTFPHHGSKLELIEAHTWQPHQHVRKPKYRFMRNEGELIFQVDSHGKSIPIQEPLHLHKGPTETERLEDGCWELDGLSLRDFDFLKMWELVRAYIEDGRFPWRA